MEILDKLHADHERLREVLALLERELTAGEAGEDADLQLMQDIVTHYSEYFNRIHHPLENRVFEYMVRRGALRRHGAERALVEHGELIASSARFRLLLDRALSDGIMPRDELIDAGWRFLNDNLGHMDDEERTAFRWARESLAEADWAAIRAQTNAVDEGVLYSQSLKDECCRYLELAGWPPAGQSPR